MFWPTPQWPTGYRPGSYNPRPFQADAGRRGRWRGFQAYELGFKSDLFDRRLRTNLAVFYTDWKSASCRSAAPSAMLIDAGSAARTPGDRIQDSDRQPRACLRRDHRPGRSIENSRRRGRRASRSSSSWEPVDGLAFSGMFGWIDWSSPEIDDCDFNQDGRPMRVTCERPPYVPEDNWALRRPTPWPSAAERA